MIRFRIRALLILALVIAGISFSGNGAYIYAKALLAQELIKLSWEQTLHQQESFKPWPWADTWPVGRLKVPSLDIDQIVLAGDSGHSLAFGPGLNSASVQPGNKGTVLISAHRDTHFRFLQRLKKDDEILLQAINGDWFLFTVSSTEVVHESSYNSEVEEKTRLALVTCYPFESIVPGGDLRYIVYADLHSQRNNWLQF
jgi:sortase A